ncbi:4Fe-4S dicluster domain-containing protein [bacterium]|nr:4Fe-4S dicluster domain-containing protein [bacterium]
MNQVEQTQNYQEVDPSSDSLKHIREMIQSCIQCGTCTGSCPNEFAMDHTPRQLWRMVLMGQKDAIFHSRTFSLCSSCYSCTLRCPRGLPLTDAMHQLKLIAVREKLSEYKIANLFYKSFLDSVNDHGRVRELGMMTHFFLTLTDPMVVLKFASLGLKLMSKGKLSPHFGSKGDLPLGALFKKVEEMEKNI